MEFNIYNSGYYDMYRHYFSKGEKYISPGIGVVRDFLHLKHTDYFLDVGCGVGYMLDLLPHTVLKVGIDISPKALDIARKTFPKCFYVQANGTKIPFRNDTFDKILCNAVIEHCDDQYNLLNEIKRILKPGGHLVITTPNKYSFGCLLMKLFGYGDPSHVRELTVNQLLCLIQKHFKVIEAKRASFIIRFHPRLNKLLNGLTFLRPDIVVLAKKEP